MTHFNPSNWQEEKLGRRGAVATQKHSERQAAQGSTLGPTPPDWVMATLTEEMTDIRWPERPALGHTISFEG